MHEADKERGMEDGRWERETKQRCEEDDGYRRWMGSQPDRQREKERGGEGESVLTALPACLPTYLSTYK